MSTHLISALVTSAAKYTEDVGAIGYENLFVADGVTVTASDEVVGYEKENAYDWKQYDWWKQSATGESWLRASLPYAQSASYMSVWGHNLHEVGGYVKAQYSTDNGSTWSDASGDVMPGDKSTIFLLFDSIVAGDFRLLVTTQTGQSIIAGVMIGPVLKLERDVTAGFAPASLSPMVGTKTAMSELGINLGSSTIRTGIAGTIPLSNLSSEWVRAKWVPLINHLNTGRKCVFCWDTAKHLDEAVLIWKKGQIPVPVQTSAELMTASLTFEGVQ